MKPPVLLCYNIRPENLGKIRMSAMRLRIRLAPVSKADYAQTLGALCGLSPMRAQVESVDDFEEELLIMGNFPDPLAGQFLQMLRKEKVPQTLLKAVLTPSNAQWDSVALYTELSRERDALRSGAFAHRTPESAPASQNPDVETPKIS